MSVELIDHYGDDLRVVNAARVSFHKESKWVSSSPTCESVDHLFCSHGIALSEADKGLISFLMRNQHCTPFEMVDFTFRVRVPIGVAREWQRHRTFSYNEESTRYVEMRPDFYVPNLGDQIRTQTGKPGAYMMEPIPAGQAERIRTEILGHNEDAYSTYLRLLDMGLAREVARNVLPLGLLTEFWVKGNLRNWFHFLHLRTAPNALLEIRQAAQSVEELIAPVVPVCYAAWVEAGRPSM